MNTDKQNKMASEQTSHNEFITKTVAEAARVAIQTMAMTSTPRQDNTGLKMSGSITSMKNCKTSN